VVGKAPHHVLTDRFAAGWFESDIPIGAATTVARERFAVQLSRQFFAEITGVQPEPSTGGAPGGERRLHPRIPFDRRARIFPLMEGSCENGAPILIRDISVGGIGFLYAEPISVGDEFVLRLFTAAPPGTPEEPVDIQCAARHCEMGGTCGSQFAVGATFELVLNHPLATSVAPESEMTPVDTEMVDQPAAPTIEQRYDQQCITSRQIRPIIRETSLDRWLARPQVKRVTDALAFVTGPALAIWKRIHSLIQIGEDSRIRHRLNPSKSAKKRRPKKPAAAVAAAAATVPPPADKTPAQLKLDIDAQLTKALHPALFSEGRAIPEAGREPVGPGHRSIFAASEDEAAVILPVPPPAEKIAPAPLQQAAAPVRAAEAVAVAEPAPIIAAAEESVAPSEPIALEVAETISLPALAVQAESAPLVEAEPPIESAPSRVDEPKILSQKPKPPVAHARHLRRRPRPTFHR
jgi:hypothetical protein